MGNVLSHYEMELEKIVDEIIAAETTLERICILKYYIPYTKLKEDFLSKRFLYNKNTGYADTENDNSIHNPSSLE